MATYTRIMIQKEIVTYIVTSIQSQKTAKAETTINTLNNNSLQQQRNTNRCKKTNTTTT